MSNSETVDLMSIGAHCSVPSCGQKDFLPFTCSACGDTFCGEHRTYEAHQCPARAGSATEGQAVVCPLCAHAIKLSPGQDGNAAFDAHTRSGACDPSNYARVHRKKSCPLPRCREKLTTLNRYQCKRCGLEVCMSHRFPADHGCDARLEAAKKSFSSRWSRFSTSGKFSIGGSGTSNAGRASSTTTSSSRIGAKLTQWVNPASQQTQAAQQKGEACRQCGARFSTPSQLSTHIREYHPAQDSRSDRDICPRCGRQFADAVELVEHVEGGCKSKQSACRVS